MEMEMAIERETERENKRQEKMYGRYVYNRIAMMEDDVVPSRPWKEVIYEAVKERDGEKLDKLVKEHGVQILDRKADAIGTAVLHDLVVEGDVKGIELLLSKGADVMVEDWYRSIPLHQALYYNNSNEHIVEAVMALLKHGGDPCAQILKREHCAHFERTGRTPLHIMAAASHTDRTLLLQQEMVSALMKCNYGSHLSLSGDYIAAARRPAHDDDDDGHILSLADLKFGATPLHYAVGMGNVEGAQLLLNSGAPPHATDKYGATPFHYAARGGLLHLFHDHLQHNTSFVDQPAAGNGLRALHYAAWNGRAHAVHWLLQRNASSHLADVHGNTPLHLAAMGGHSIVIEKILNQDQQGWGLAENSEEKAAGQEQQNKNRSEGQQDILAKYNSKEPNMMELILKTNKAGKWALGLAAHQPAARAILSVVASSLTKHKLKEFLSASQESDGATLMHFFAAYGTEENLNQIVRSIKSHSTDFHRKTEHITLDMRDKENMNPVHWAAMKGNIAALRVLSGTGIDLNVNCHKWNGWPMTKTPLYLALFEYKNMEFASELMTLEDSTCTWLGEDTIRDWMRDLYVTKLTVKLTSLKQDLKKYEPVTILSHEDIFFELPPIFLALYAGEDNLAEFFQTHTSKGAEYDAVNARGGRMGRTPLHWATILRQRRIVAALCRSSPCFKDSLTANVEDKEGKTALQYALNVERKGKGMKDRRSSSYAKESDKDIEKELLMREDVKGQVEALYKDRQLYVDAANAILVGAALIAGVTFAGWLQPPLGYVEYYNLPVPMASASDGQHYQSYAAIQQNMSVRFFWIFNCLSFSFAVATVTASLIAVVPVPHVYIGSAVLHLNRWLLIAAPLLGLSILFVLGAFAAAGFAVLPPLFKYQRYMLATSMVGAVPCLSLLMWFTYRVLVLIHHVCNEETITQAVVWFKKTIVTLTCKFSQKDEDDKQTDKQGCTEDADNVNDAEAKQEIHKRIYTYGSNYDSCPWDDGLNFLAPGGQNSTAAH